MPLPIRRIAALLLALGVTVAQAQEQAQDRLPGQSGRFPVFGPSAEREAFFAGQEEARQRRLDEIRAERAAAEEAARLQRLQPPERVVVRRTGTQIYPFVICEPFRRVAPDDPINAGAPMLAPYPVVPFTRPGEPQRVCRTVYRPYPPFFLPRPYPIPRTDLELRFGPEGASGSLLREAPGLRFSVDVE